MDRRERFFSSDSCRWNLALSKALHVLGHLARERLFTVQVILPVLVSGAVKRGCKRKPTGVGPIVTRRSLLTDGRPSSELAIHKYISSVSKSSRLMTHGLPLGDACRPLSLWRWEAMSTRKILAALRPDKCIVDHEKKKMEQADW